MWVLGHLQRDLGLSDTGGWRAVIGNYEEMTEVSTRMLEAQLCLFRKYVAWRAAFHERSRRSRRTGTKAICSLGLVRKLRKLMPRGPPSYREDVTIKDFETDVVGRSVVLGAVCRVLQQTRDVLELHFQSFVRSEADMKVVIRLLTGPQSHVWGLNMGECLGSLPQDAWVALQTAIPYTGLCRFFTNPQDVGGFRHAIEGLLQVNRARWEVGAAGRADMAEGAQYWPITTSPAPCEAADAGAPANATGEGVGAPAIPIASFAQGRGSVLTHLDAGLAFDSVRAYAPWRTDEVAATAYGSLTANSGSHDEGESRCDPSQCTGLRLSLALGPGSTRGVCCLGSLAPHHVVPARTDAGIPAAATSTEAAAGSGGEVVLQTNGWVVALCKKCCRPMSSGTPASSSSTTYGSAMAALYGEAVCCALQAQGAWPSLVCAGTGGDDCYAAAGTQALWCMRAPCVSPGEWLFWGSKQSASRWPPAAKPEQSLADMVRFTRPVHLRSSGHSVEWLATGMQIVFGGFQPPVRCSNLAADSALAANYARERRSARWGSVLNGAASSPSRKDISRVNMASDFVCCGCLHGQCVSASASGQSDEAPLTKN